MSHPSSSASSLETTETELRKMILTFRVHELQHLLAFANKNKAGKKTELLARAIDLIKNTRSLQVQQKVRELFRRRFPEQRYGMDLANGVGNDPLTGMCVSPPAYGSSSSSSSSSAYQTPSVAAASAFLNNIPGFLSPNNMIVDSHPDVKFARLPFYDWLSTLVKPTLLRPLSAQKYQENYVAFSLTTEQIREISYPDNAPLPRVEVQLRFCVVDLSSEQKDDFPSGIEVRMNDKVVQLPNPIPTNKPGVEPKRPSRPVNITPYCKPSQPQRIYIHWSADASKNFVVGVFLVRRVTSTILLQRLKDKGLTPLQNSKLMIKRNLASDNEIATTSLRVSLHCPLGKMRMQIPCRLSHCKHLQCFDADLFLRMNEKKPTWVCPVCDRPTPFDDLIIDGYFTDVLLKAGKDVSEIELLENGEWIRIDKDDSDDSDDSRSPQPPSVSHESRSVKSSVGGGDSSSDSNALSRLTSPSSTSSPARVSWSSSNAANNVEASTSAKDNTNSEVVIDLTEESDDETTITTTIRSPASSSSKNLRANSLSQSCSASPSEESIIILDSPPSRSNATPEDPVESFIRASQNIMNSTSSSSSSTGTTMTTNPNRNLSPPKKRFKPVSPLVTGSSLAAPTNYVVNNNNSQAYSSSSRNNNSNVACTPPALPTTIDYSGSTTTGGGGGGAYNSYRHSTNNYYGTTNYVSNQSPLPHSPYGGSDVTSTTMTPHSAPPLPNGTTFFAPQPPPLHYGPSSMVQQSMASNYFSMLTSFGQHAAAAAAARGVPSAYANYGAGDQHQTTNNLGVNDLYPLFDSRLQAEYQKFLSSCLPDNGTS